MRLGGPDSVSFKQSELMHEWPGEWLKNLFKEVGRGLFQTEGGKRMSEFKLIKELGLSIFKPFGDERRNEVVYARDVEALLQKGSRIEFSSGFKSGFVGGPMQNTIHHHGDAIILTLPRKEDTAESLLEEILKHGGWPMTADDQDLWCRVKKVLGKP